METLLQQIVNGLVLGAVYALVALGYTMVYGILGLINFAHGEVVMVGALVTLAVIKPLAAAGVPHALLLPLGLAVAMAVCMALGATVERVAYRPLRNAPRLAPLITAIGVSIVLQYSVVLIWGRSYHAYPELLPTTSLSFFGVHVSPAQIAIIVLSTVVMAALLWLVHRTRLGRAMRATAENRGAADGCRCRSRHIADLRHRLGPGRRGRRTGQHQLFGGPLPDGLRPRPQGLHRGGAGRHRQPGRGDGRRPGPGTDRGAGFGLHRRTDRRAVRLQLSRRFRLPGPGAGADLPPVRPARRTPGGTRLMPSERRRPWWGMLLLAAVLAVLPFATGLSLGPAWVRVLDFCLLYILLALGLHIVVGYAGLLDLGYVAFYAVGAYVYALLSSPHLTSHFP